MRVSILASGSSGNALVVEGGGRRILVDCGISARQLARRMGTVGLAPSDLDVILVSHEHIDHVRGLQRTASLAGCPVLTTAGTARALGASVELGEPLVAGRSLRLNGLEIEPVATSHDAAEPVAFVFTDAHCHIAVVTDTGVVPEPLFDRLSGCRALFLEANHDPDMLRQGRYPWPLKQRIASPRGHLSNEQSRCAVERLAHGGLEFVVGMHLSRENNTPSIAISELGRPLAGSSVRVVAAHHEHPMVVDVGHEPPRKGQLALFEQSV